MNVFITGATGFIGGGVARAMIARGDRVTALVRPATDASSLERAGARIVRGELVDLPSLRSEVARSEVSIHAAQAQENTADADRTAIEVFTSMPRGVFVFTSGVWVLGNRGATATTEDSAVDPLPISAWRAPLEKLVLDAGRADFSAAVLRPGCVYGHRQSLLAGWFRAVDSGQPVRVIGNGENRWSMVHLNDLADCYLRIVDRKAGGVFHATDDSAETMDVIAAAVSGGRVPIEHVELAAARARMGSLADALAVDQHVSSAKTRETLGWAPKTRTFLGSVEQQWQEWREKS
jgi:nucleoside-diphosphate-sugar epimerase